MAYGPHYHLKLFRSAIVALEVLQESLDRSCIVAGLSEGKLEFIEILLLNSLVLGVTWTVAPFFFRKISNLAL